ncbi:MAG: hypothetical protein KatS3mg121_0707 [Gammaproteobacteria bacterium]|nr:MAG: hypothetical protein KatS3mg121_0707 [Gammaproteobacteria bacterium]
MRRGRLLAAALLGAAAAAADPWPEVVVSAERRARPQADSAAAIGLRPPLALEQGADHVAADLDTLPGVDIERGAGQTHLTAIRSPVLNGPAGAGAFLYLEDEVPLRSAAFGNVNALLEAQAEFAETIEVLRGPGGAAQGANALHGLIHLRSPDARFAQARFSLWTGPYQRVRSTALERWGDGDAATLLGLHLGHDGGFRQDAGYRQEKLLLRRDEARQSWKLAWQRLDERSAGFVIGEDAYRDRARLTENDAAGALRRADALRAQWLRRFDTDQGQARTIVYLRRQRQHFTLHWLPGDPVEDHRVDAVGLRSDWRAETAWGAAQAGVDLDLARGTLREWQAAPAIFGYPQGLHYDYRVDTRSLAPHLRLEWHPAPALRLTAGARWETLLYDYDNRATDGVDGRLFRPSDRRDRFSAFTPELALLYRPASAWTVWLRAARGARPPQAAELYRLQAHQQGWPGAVETLDSLEAGLRWGGARWRSDLVAYTARKDDLIFRDAEGVNVTGAASEHRGLELDLAAALTGTLELALGASRARHRWAFSRRYADPALAGEAIRAGDDIDHAPRRLGHAALTWRPGPWTAVLAWRHVGPYFMDAANRHRYPGHDRVDLVLARALAAGWSLALRVENAGDARYAERADYAFGDARYFPGEPRGVYLGLSWRAAPP